MAKDDNTPVAVLKVMLNTTKEELSRLEEATKAAVTKEELELYLNPINDKIANIEECIKKIKDGQVSKSMAIIISILLAIIAVLGTILAEILG